MSIGEEFKKLSTCAVNSFKKFHPDINLHYVDETNIDSFECYKNCDSDLKNHVGIFRFNIAAEIMETHGYDKFIMLGGDTITCAVLDDFLDDNVNDMLLTSCYAYQLNIGYVTGDKRLFKKGDASQASVLSTPVMCGVFDDKQVFKGLHLYFGNIYEIASYFEEFEKREGHSLTMFDHLYANADVICFNSLDALKDVVRYTKKHWDDYHGDPKDFVDWANVVYMQDKYLAEHGLFFLADQGGINIVSTLSLANSTNTDIPAIRKSKNPDTLPNHKVRFIDVPYATVPFCYNVRSKKSIEESNLPIGKILTNSTHNKFVLHPKAHPKCGGEEGLSMSKYYVKDGKLFTVDGKQIKVWHYLCSLGLYTENQNHGRINKLSKKDLEKLSASEIDGVKKQFCDMVNSYTQDGVFNEETKKFFTDCCDCGDFFNKAFTLE